MTEVAMGALCANHPDRPALANCARCGKPICATCRTEDIAADAVYCSAACRDTARSERAGLPAITDAELLAGYQRPILIGWKLWARTLPTLLAYTAPLALGMALVFGALAGMQALGGAEQLNEGEFLLSDALLWVAFVPVLYGIAVIQVLFSQRYTGLLPGNPLVLALRRFVPWCFTLALVLAATAAGYVLLIIPGIIIGLRLFWADEFALVHQAGPIRALKESWELTRGELGAIFTFQFLAGFAAMLPTVAMVLAFAAVGRLMAGMEGTGAQLLQGSLLFFFLMNVYGASHAPELVYFYGLRASRSAPVTSTILGV